MATRNFPQCSRLSAPSAFACTQQRMFNTKSPERTAGFGAPGTKKPPQLFGAKHKPESFIDNSILAEICKSGSSSRLHVTQIQMLRILLPPNVAHGDPRGDIELTHVTFDGSIKGEWVNSAGADTSSFGGKVITPRGMFMYIETKNLSWKWDLDNHKAMRGHASKKVVGLIEKLKSEGLL